VAVLLVTCMATGSALAKTTDRNQRTNVGSDSSDCVMDEAGPCVLTGNVTIEQGTMDIKASKADIRRGGGEIQSIKLSGSPVTMKQQNDDGGWVNATAMQVDYDLPKDTVVFTGNASIRQPGHGSIAGERIIYNMRTGQVQSGGAAGGGRVNMVFEPKNPSPAAPKPKRDETPADTQDDDGGTPPAQDDN